MNYCMCIILLIATVYDLKYRIIPNWLLCIGGIIGLLSPRTMCSYTEKIICIVVIFIIGMFHLMGMGDVKLWTVMAMYIGLIKSVCIMGIAAVFLILFQLLRNRKETAKVLRISINDLLLTKKIHYFEQDTFPFSPYIFAGYVFGMIIGII